MIVSNVCMLETLLILTIYICKFEDGICPSQSPLQASCHLHIDSVESQLLCEVRNCLTLHANISVNIGCRSLSLSVIVCTNNVN